MQKQQTFPFSAFLTVSLHIVSCKFSYFEGAGGGGGAEGRGQREVPEASYPPVYRAYLILLPSSAMVRLLWPHIKKETSEL